MKSNLIPKAIVAILILNVVVGIIFVFTQNNPPIAEAHVPEQVVEAKPLPASSKSYYKKIRSGDTVYSLLSDYKFNKAQVGKILGMKLIPDTLILVPGHKYRVIEDKAQNSFELKFYDRRTDNTYVLWRKGDDAGGGVRKEPYKLKIKTIEGNVEGSILAAITSKVPDRWIAHRFMDAYALEFDFRRELQRGAYFSVTYEEKYDGEEFIKCGEVLQAKLQMGNEIVARHFIRYTDGGSFVAPTQLFEERPLYSPVDYMRISSQFNPRRFHPIKRRRQPHMGIDFALPTGEEVYAVKQGKVLRTGKNRAAGRYVVIRHPNGLESYYNHMHTIKKSIRPGVYVKSGQQVGTIGCSGYCTKAHLHFAVKKRGRFIDPIKLLRSYPYQKKEFIERKVATIPAKSQPIQTN